MEACLVRSARGTDYPAVADIMAQVQALHVQWRPDIYRATVCALPREEFDEWTASGTLLVAEHKGRVIGMLFYGHRHVASDTQVTRDVLFIHCLAVTEAARGQGVGRQLVNAVKQAAQEEGLDGVELQVNARNNAGRHFYERLGFTEKSINMELL